MRKATKAAETATDWMSRNWRPIAAFVYLGICIFDFVIGPIFMGLTQENTEIFARSIAGLDPSVQAILAAKPNNGWTPLTVMGGGMFHISFGAIVGVSAFQRGMDKFTQMQAENYTQQPPAYQPPYQPPAYQPPYQPPAYQPPYQPPMDAPAQNQNRRTDGASVDSPEGD
jgi:hypothetical protein